jgi:murein DD-endopeptidase MepM/ murein hydrolase activator NlpD
MKLPDIKKYAGNLFTAGSVSDPLKSIGALAAFSAASKLGKGDFMGAAGPGLIAAGILFGPSLLGRGIGSMMNRGGAGTPTPGGAPSSGGGAQTKAGKAYAGMQAQRNLPGWAQRAAGGSASRFAASNERLFQGTANIGDRARVATGGRFGIGSIAEKIATRGGGSAAQVSTRAGGTAAAKAAGVGARAIPLLGTALSVGLSAYRFSQGDVVGGILSAVSAIPVIGWAALGVDLARETGAFDGTILGRGGQDKLKKQTEQQKKLVERKKESRGQLTFSKTLDRYEKVINKFEQVSKHFKLTARGEFDEPPMPAPTPVVPGAGYEGPISGDTFFPLPGGDVGTQGVVSSSQAFGASRDGGSRSHQGLDMTHHQGALDAAVVAYKTGKVVAAVSNGYNGYVEIDHGGGLRTLYYHTSPMVAVGEEVYGGQQIAKLYPSGQNTHLHFGISNNGSYTDPLPHVKSVKNRISSPLSRERAKQQNDTSPQVSAQPGASFAISPLFQQGSTGLSIGPGGFNIGGRPAAQMSAPKQPSRPIATNLPYQSGYAEPTIVPYPIVQQMQQQMMAQGSSGPVIISGPSEEQLLNSFYKKVLLNTLK